MKCTVPICPSIGTTQTGFCQEHEGMLFQGMQSNGNGRPTFPGVTLWTANEDRFAYGIAWTVADNPLNALDLRVVDFGIYRTALPEAEKGTIQETAAPRPMVRFEGGASVELDEALIQAFRTAFQFVENDSRFALLRRMPTYLKQMRQAVTLAIQETAPTIAEGRLQGV